MSRGKCVRACIQTEESKNQLRDVASRVKASTRAGAGCGEGKLGPHGTYMKLYEAFHALIRQSRGTHIKLFPRPRNRVSELQPCPQYRVARLRSSGTSEFPEKSKNSDEAEAVFPPGHHGDARRRPVRPKSHGDARSWKLARSPGRPRAGSPNEPDVQRPGRKCGRTGEGTGGKTGALTFRGRKTGVVLVA